MSYSERNALLDAVAFSWGVTASDVLGTSRLRKHVEARRAAALAMLARGVCVSEAARLLRRNHSTILQLVGRRGVRTAAYAREALRA